MLINPLKEYDCQVDVYDPRLSRSARRKPNREANPEEVKQEYGIDLLDAGNSPLPDELAGNPDLKANSYQLTTTPSSSPFPTT